MAYPSILGIPIFGNDEADRGEGSTPAQQPIQSIVNKRDTADTHISNYRPPRVSAAPEDEADAQAARRGSRTFSYGPLRVSSAPPADDQDSIFRTIIELKSAAPRDAGRATRTSGDEGCKQPTAARKLSPPPAPLQASPAPTDDDGFAAAAVIEDSESDREGFTPPYAGRRFDCTSGLDDRRHIDKGKGVFIDVVASDLSMMPPGGGTARITPDPSDVENADHIPLESDDEESDIWRADEPEQQAGPRGQKRHTYYGAAGRGHTEPQGRSSAQGGRSGDPAQAKRPRLTDESPLPEHLLHRLGPGKEPDSWLPVPVSRTTTAPAAEPETPEEQPSRSSRSRRTSKPKTLRPATYHAFIKELYKAPDEKMMRIIKCLERCKHPNTTKAEGSAAMRLAQRLMADHNVAEAEVLSHMPVEEQARRASRSVVSVRRVVDIGKEIRLGAFVWPLSNAMGIFFDCKSYSGHRTDAREFTFYGIAENTAFAAEAFKNIHNLIAEWARSEKGSHRRDYCIGVAEELEYEATKAKTEELHLAERAEAEKLAEREEEERIQRQRELDRLRPLGSESEEEPEASTAHGTTASSGPDIVDLMEDTSDSDPESSASSRRSRDSNGLLDTDNDVDMESGSSETSSDTDSKSEGGSDVDYTDVVETGETEDDVLNLPSPMPPPPVPSLGRATSAREETPWESSGQLIAFRQRATLVAEEYLKRNGITLTTARPPAPVRNWAAWRKGKEDSKKINVREQAQR
ncbi:hypothetical protein DBV05_g4555 [Lasiodiplodia theobromae]|uniref:Uncharacterized protein n=1 Tax=Lasiodiplodia theobromae TaxID=45133 RepID=A0A5N5DG27_9PEZI|nr:hypothetical protein DBV05_g4555 [Lasiodiplodia theobromae]